MMRLHRASVITALCVLTQVATAYAECAWVIWATRDAPEGGSYSLPVQANETRKTCEAHMWSASRRRFSKLSRDVREKAQCSSCPF
jgi:hypothetical protein